MLPDERAEPDGAVGEPTDDAARCAEGPVEGAGAGGAAGAPAAADEPLHFPYGAAEYGLLPARTARRR